MIDFLNTRLLKILLAVGALGFIISHPSLLGWLGMQAPWYVFVLWYIVFFGFISFIGITLFPGKFRLRHALGLLVLWFGLSPVLGWADNAYLSERLTGATVTGVEVGPEESILAWLWLRVTNDINVLVFLVYVLTPVAFVLFAFLILKPEPFFRFFKRIVHI